MAGAGERHRGGQLLGGLLALLSLAVTVAAASHCPVDAHPASSGHDSGAPTIALDVPPAASALAVVGSEPRNEHGAPDDSGCSYRTAAPPLANPVSERPGIVIAVTRVLPRPLPARCPATTEPAVVAGGMRLERLCVLRT